jgi:hypothetical protein
LRIRFIPVAAALALILPAAIPGAFAAGAETTVTPAARTALGLTIYNDNLALVRDARRVSLKPGATAIRFEDVTNGINPSSVFIEQSPSGALTIREVNYDADTPNWDALLAKSVGKTVRIRSKRKNKNKAALTTAILLGVSGSQALVEMDGQARTVSKNRLIVDLPPGPRHLNPSLAILGDAPSLAEVELALTYMTSGLTWRADYAGRLNADETSLALTGFVTLSNATGAAFDNASVRVVAGAVNRSVAPIRARRQTELTTMKALGSSGPREASIADVHVISIGENLAIGPNQTKQFALFKTRSIPIKKEYRLENHGASYNRSYRAVVRDQPVIRLVFRNDAASGMGRVLPSGVMRIYATGDGAPLFLGETSMTHTPRDETVRLTTGRAFEINAKRRQTSYKRSGLPKGVFESGHEITIHNAKTKPVTVTVAEHIPGDWSILEESKPHEKPQSNQAIWKIDVPASGEVKLTYSVRVQF